MNNIKTVLHAYYYDVSVPEDKEKYDSLCRYMKEKGVNCFRTSGISSHYLSKLSGELELETEYLFSNQWNTAPTADSENGYRVFDWAEDYQRYNHDLKKGHWLEQTEEMFIIRKDRYKCGYCGKQYHKPKQVFCLSCLGSEYLKEDNLFLLRLVSIMDKKRGKELTKEEEDYLTPLYEEAQNKTKIAKIEKEKARTIENYKEAIKNSEIAKDGYLWLLSRGCLLDSVVYSDYQGRFCFGCGGETSRIDNSKALELELILKDFPYPYEIKCKDGSVMVRKEGR